MFHEPERVVLELPTGSDIREVIYRSRFSDSAPVGLREVPKSFGYFPGHVLKHPWLNETDLQKLPLLALSSPDECPQTAEDWNRRDTVFIESSAVGTVRLAELLLNAGCPSNTVREVDLEGDAGFRGVAPLSAELRIVLPGSPIWTSRPGEKCSDQ